MTVEPSSWCCPSCGGPTAYWFDMEAGRDDYPEGAPVWRVCAPRRPDGSEAPLNLDCLDEHAASWPWPDVDEGINAPDPDDLDEQVGKSSPCPFCGLVVKYADVPAEAPDHVCPGCWPEWEQQIKEGSA